MLWLIQSYKIKLLWETKNTFFVRIWSWTTSLTFHTGFHSFFKQKLMEISVSQGCYSLPVSQVWREVMLDQLSFSNSIVLDVTGQPKLLCGTTSREHFCHACACKFACVHLLVGVSPFNDEHTCSITNIFNLTIQTPKIDSFASFWLENSW